MSHSDLDSGLDWAEKVYDMAMTAIAISKLSASDDATTIPSIFRPDKAWKGRLMPYVYRILGLFTKVRKRRASMNMADCHLAAVRPLARLALAESHQGHLADWLTTHMC